MQKIIVIHRWGGAPEDDWYPWLKQNIEETGVEVIIPEMPDTESPQIEKWLAKIAELDKKNYIDENTCFVGHSIGCQAILRYLAKSQKKVKGIILVAPWIDLKPIIKQEGAEGIAQPWIQTPIDWEKINAGKIIALFSEDDPYVYVEDSEVFKEKLGTEIIIEKNQGHYNGRKYEIILKEVNKIINER